MWQARRRTRADGSTTANSTAASSGAVGGQHVSVTGAAGSTAGQDAITIVGGFGPTAVRDMLAYPYLPGLPAAEPVAGARVRLQATSAQLAADLTPLVGRDTELAELHGFFTAPEQVGPRVAVLSGLPGVGKSALAAQLAHQLTGRVGRLPLYADLRGLGTGRRDPAEVLGRFLRAFQVPAEAMPTGLEERADLYQALLADERALVILDNAADANQIRLLLPEGSQCLALVTTRARLALRDALLINLEVLSEPATVELLERLAGPERIAHDRQAALALARACGGLPLAVRIAGGRLRSRPTWRVATLARELADQRQRLGRLKVKNLDVRASFALSYDELPEKAACAFRLLGLLPGPESDAGAAAALTGEDPAVVKDVMDQLVDAELLEVVRPGRYRLHDLLYLFAQELVGEESEAARQAALGREGVWWVQNTLAQNFEVEAEWRDDKAQEWPEEPKNARVAEGLRRLAKHIRHLPYDDPRLRHIAQVWFSPDVDEHTAQALVERYGFGPGSHLGLLDYYDFLIRYTDEWIVSSQTE